MQSNYYSKLSSTLHGIEVYSPRHLERPTQAQMEKCLAEKWNKGKRLQLGHWQIIRTRMANVIAFAKNTVTGKWEVTDYYFK